VNKARISIVFLLILLVTLLTAISVTSATANAYIKINNGSTIVTNKGQKPQIVVQFGNRGQKTIEKVSVICYYSHNLGTPVAIYPRVLESGLKLNNIFGGGADVVSFGGPSKPVDLIAGQNHDVAFDLNITASRGAQGTVQCVLFSDVTLVASSSSTTIKVQ
jgi:hypothetical protein